MFKDAIDGIMSDLEDKTYGVVQSTANDLLNTLTSAEPIGTPRDTGYAANSWQFDTDGVITTDYTLASVENAAMALSIQTMSKDLISIRMLKGKDTLYLVNPVFYIRDLNDLGTSKKSPPMFVQTATQIATQKQLQ